MKRLFFQLFTCLALSLFVLAFTAEAQNKKRVVGNATPTVVANKPGVYVSFGRLGKRTPLRDDESGEGIWLRLHNNMRYSISLCAFGISDEGEQLITYGKNTQVGVKYDVVLNPVAITDERPKIDVPVGYNTGSTCHLFEVKSGRSMVFAVPAEHLVKGLSIKIPFSYEWEDETVGNPTHFVYFNSLSIPETSLGQSK
jgi:hypothetical protein